MEEAVPERTHRRPVADLSRRGRRVRRELLPVDEAPEPPADEASSSTPTPRSSRRRAVEVELEAADVAEPSAERRGGASRSG